MKIRYIPYLTIVLAALLLSACHSIMDDEVCADQPSDTTTPVQIGFTLTTGDVSSRAITEGEDPGSERENYIDIANNNFRILLFNTDNKYLTALKVNRITQTGNDGTTYYVEGELDEAYTDFKLVVLANWGMYADNWTSETGIADVCETTYSYAIDFDIDDDLIPMYGVQTYNDVELRANLLTQLTDEIDLLRAMAKIEVTCSAEDITLTGATLHHYNTSGHCAPANVYSDTADDWGWSDNDVCNHTVHIPADVSSADNLPFTPTDEGYIVYVPEFDNTDVTRQSYISVSLQHSDDNAPVNLDNTNIYFCEYNTETGEPTDNTDFDIVRNHWYKYDITHVDDGELIFQYRVMKWNVESSEIGWNVTEDLCTLIAEGGDEQNGTLGDPEAKYCFVCYPRYDEDYDNHTVLEAASSGATFTFTLTAPEGAVWKAHLSNEEDFHFSTGPISQGNNKKNATTGIARTEPYRINILANNPWTTGTSFTDETGNFEDNEEVKTEFYITVSLADGSEYELPINPVVENSYYINGRRFAGDSATRITIWQLRARRESAYDDLIGYYGYNEWWNN